MTRDGPCHLDGACPSRRLASPISFRQKICTSFTSSMSTAPISIDQLRPDARRKARAPGVGGYGGRHLRPTFANLRLSFASNSNHLVPDLRQPSPQPSPNLRQRFQELSCRPSPLSPTFFVGITGPFRPIRPSARPPAALAGASWKTGTRRAGDRCRAAPDRSARCPPCCEKCAAADA